MSEKNVTHLKSELFAFLQHKIAQSLVCKRFLLSSLRDEGIEAGCDVVSDINCHFCEPFILALCFLRLSLLQLFPDFREIRLSVAFVRQLIHQL